MNIVAIGGGGLKSRSGELVRSSFDLCPVEKPNVLYVPSARPTQEAHEKSVALAREFFVDDIGVHFETLHEWSEIPTQEEVEHKIRNANLTYIAGGDTERAQTILRFNRMGQILKDQIANGKLISTGISAGAILPMKWGHSDSMSYKIPEGEKWDYIPVEGLGLVNVAITPHADNLVNGQLRRDKFANMIKDCGEKFGTVFGFALDNGAAMCVYDNVLKPVILEPGSEVHLIKYTAGMLDVIPLTSQDAITLQELQDYPNI